MTHFIRAYLRTSTNEQNAQRARGSLDRFAHEHGVVICNYYAENASGAHLKRPELFRLLAAHYADPAHWHNVQEPSLG